MNIQFEARAFAIWRYANAHNRDCSYDEIADATGLTYNQVGHIIKRKEGAGLIGERRGGGGSTSEGAAKAHRTKGHRFDENALDLCELIGAC